MMPLQAELLLLSACRGTGPLAAFWLPRREVECEPCQRHQHVQGVVEPVERKEPPEGSDATGEKPQLQQPRVRNAKHQSVSLRGREAPVDG